ncbi:hypothetical protein [Puniceibacterium sp. IMCC21224]|uniref:hypothetical protein n=1 Tax=Puniceibacterium sp. IMCC21224 TaxID=1618204 RepID=UPI00064D7BF8|nr:hypothetical protein [Puniceibacterium sp. IMCC21224]KMK65245.1 hypothetical protein IMCC21224_1175 [Puniceibacterium sp. IMCC21224]
MAAPVLRDIVRRHAEESAHLWCVYDWHLLHPDENPDMDEERMDRLIERLNAHLDGLRVAGEDGQVIAQERYDAFPEAGELFVLRMLQPAARHLRVHDLDLDAVRDYLDAMLPGEEQT